MTKINLSNTVIGMAAAAAATTAAAVAYKAYGEELQLPHGKYFYNNQEAVQQYQGQYDYYTLEQKSYISISEQIEVLHAFSNSILDNIKEIAPEFSAVVDEKFWDLF